jgi:hypothetical protein
MRASQRQSMARCRARAERSGAAWISCTAGFGSGSCPAFRVSLAEKPTVLQTATCHASICALTLR